DGKKKFANIGEFIQFIYKYGFMIGSIVAVVMMIISGLMWILSGGNQDTIGKAQKRISGAIIGLVLMATSYTVLNTVNPYLVNLRLPDVWLINSTKLPGNSCKTVLQNSASSSLALAYETKTVLKITEQQKKTLLSKLKQSDFKVAGTDSLKCGSEYFVNGSGTNTCSGYQCTDMKKPICVPFDIEGAGSGFFEMFEKDIKHYGHCWGGEIIVHAKVDSQSENIINMFSKNLAGTIEESDDDIWISDKWKSDKPDNEIQIIPVCGTIKTTLKTGTTFIKKTIITRVKKPGFDEFIYQFANVSKDVVVNCKNNPAYGFFIIYKINTQWTMTDKPILVYRESENSNILTSRAYGNGVIEPGLFKLSIPNEPNSNNYKNYYILNFDPNTVK
ncbi:MAG: hypothetical protein COU81_00040, partial [Candidatus Portnoybacteria bacterium CG10_big_fil_rev_8_21_14_0_10_36_7]